MNFRGRSGQGFDIGVCVPDQRPFERVRKKMKSQIPKGIPWFNNIGCVLWRLRGINGTVEDKESWADDSTGKEKLRKSKILRQNLIITV
jgi:hypothetical protein